ncbi:MAG: glycosyltransferase, partial [Candidatus Hodarchaeales archaeon]
MVKKKSVNLIIDLGTILEGSGIYSSATRLAQGLREYGFDVSINGREPSAIVHIHTALPQSCYRTLRYRTLRKKYHSRLPKIVIHGHTTIEDFINSFLFSNQIKPILSKYLPYYYKLADHMIAVSQHNKNLLVNYGISAEKISVISNGIRLDSAYHNSKFREAARNKLGLNTSDVLVISLGISLYRKGIDRFVNIAKKMPQIKFIWIGKRLPTGFLAHSSRIKKAYKIAAQQLNNCHFT